MSPSRNPSRTTLTIRLKPINGKGGKSLTRTYGQKGQFGRAWKDLINYTMDYFVETSMGVLEAMMGEIMFLLGDYATELIKAKMVAWGETGAVHAVTGSLMSSIKHTNTLKQYKASLRWDLRVGITPGETRYERTNLFDSGPGKYVRQYNTGELVSSYGGAKLDMMTNKSELDSEIESILSKVVKDSLELKGIMVGSSLMSLSSKISQLKNENRLIVVRAAENRIREAESRTRGRR